MKTRTSKINTKTKLLILGFILVFASLGTYMLFNSKAATSCLSTTSAIQSAVSTAAAGTSICVAPGTYGSLSLSGSHTGEVIVSPDPSLDPKTTGKVSFNSINISGSFITVKSFYLTAGGINFSAGSSNSKAESNDITGNPGQYGVNINCGNIGCSNIVVTKNKIHDLTSTVGVGSGTSCTDWGGDGDALRLDQKWDHITFSYNEITKITQVSGNCVGHNDCFQEYASINSNNLTFDHNFIHDAQCEAFLIKDSPVDIVSFTNNLFLNVSAIGQFFDTNHITFQNNTFWQSDVLFRANSSGLVASVDHNMLQNGYGNGCSSCSDGKLPMTITASNNITGGTSAQFTDTAAIDYRLKSNPNGIGVNWKPSDYTYGPVAGSTSNSGCSTTLSSGSNISTAINSAAPSSTICLEDGTYPGISLTNVNKSDYVTIKSKNGAANVNVASIYLNGVSKIIIDGITYIGSGNTTTAISNTHDIQIINSTQTSKILMVEIGQDNANILFDNNKYIDINPPCYTNNCTEGRLSFSSKNNSNNKSNVTVSNSYFGGGDADGIQVGNTNGLRIINNEFNDISAHGTAAHTDPIQLYAGSGSPYPMNTLIAGNFIHNTDSLIMAPDGSTNTQIVNNVMLGGYPYPINSRYLRGALIAHNTFNTNLNPVCPWEARCGTPWLGAGSAATNSNNVIFRDNIMGGLKNDVGSSAFSATNNLLPTGVSIGTNVINGDPTFISGNMSNLPTTFSGYQLASGSKGKNAASSLSALGVNDGKTRDIGVDFTDPLLSCKGLACTENPPTTPTCSTKQGDANGDNSVNILDISLILSAYGTTNTTSCTDVTKDGSINIQDISLVLSRYGT